jgi:hypothetical protein
VLREETDPNGSVGLGHNYNRTLADLMIDILAGRSMVQSGDGDPENWFTLESTIIDNAALEVRALTAALTPSDTEDEFTTDELIALTRLISRRLSAGAELARRFRRARWGHPNFGGGEGWEAKQQAAEAKSVKPEAAQ